MESIYKFVRDHLSVKPTLTLPQFFSEGFAEHKMIFVCEVIEKARKKSVELKRDEDLKHPPKTISISKEKDQTLHQRDNNTMSDDDTSTYVHVMSPVSITVPAVKV